MEGEPLDPLERPLNGRAVKTQPFGQLGKRGFGRLPASLGYESDHVWLFGQPAVAGQLPDRRDMPTGCADRSLEVRGFGIEDAIEVASQGARDLPSLQLQERPAGPDPAQEQADHVAALPRHHAAASPEAPRCRQTDVAEPIGEGFCVIRPDDDLEVRPATGQAQRTAGEEQPAQVGHPTVFGGGGPVEPFRRAVGGGIAGCPWSGASSAATTATQADRQPGHGSLSRWRRRREARGLGATIARPGRIDRRELRPQRGDEVAFGAAHAVTSSGRPGEARPPPRPALTLVQAQDRRCQSCWVVVVTVLRIDNVVEDQFRRRGD